MKLFWAQRTMARRLLFGPWVWCTPGGRIPGWFIGHIHQRYSFPPEIRRWQAPEDSFH